MKLNALLVSQDRPSLRVLEALLDVLQIEHQTCQSAGEAVELMVHGHHSALMMDFDLPGAGQVARMARMASAQRRPWCLPWSARLRRWAERSNRG